VTRHYGVLGVPSSVAAHWPGQERGPAALRAGGLLDALRDNGSEVTDLGDLPVARWRADAAQRNPHALDRVLAVLRDAEAGIGRALGAGVTPLVLGGECTLAVPLVTAVTRADGEPPALVYVDGGVDLRTPADEPSGVLDSMGAAHLLDLPGADDTLAAFGDRRPMLTPDRLVYVGYNDNPGPDEVALRRVTAPRFHADDVRRNPAGVAGSAVRAAESAADRFVVHFDVDVIDFYDLPVADVPLHNIGLAVTEVTAVLSVLVSAPGFAGMTVCEFNPDHSAPDGSTARALATALATALSGRPGAP
jgi:arginase